MPGISLKYVKWQGAVCNRCIWQMMVTPSISTCLHTDEQKARKRKHNPRTLPNTVQICDGSPRYAMQPEHSAYNVL